MNHTVTYPLGVNIFLTFSTAAESSLHPANDKTLSFGIFVIYIAYSPSTGFCSHHNIYKFCNDTIALNEMFVQPVQEIISDFKSGIPLTMCKTPSSPTLLLLMSTNFKNGMLLAIILQLKGVILLFLTYRFYIFLKDDIFGISLSNYMSVILLLLNYSTLVLFFIWTFFHVQVELICSSAYSGFDISDIDFFKLISG